MNYKKVIFAGLVTTGIGIVFGIILAALLPTPYQGGLYQSQRSRFAIIGGVGGLLIGMSQEAIRQLKEKQDREE